MSEAAGAKVRERVWVDKVDKTVDPPVLVERVAVEDGVVVAVQPGSEVPELERQEAVAAAIRGTAL